MLNVAIYGLGRIGRLFFKQWLGRIIKSSFRVKLLVDSMSLATSGHLIKYDSTHGVLVSPLSFHDNFIKIGNEEIQYENCKDPKELDYRKNEIDLVVDASGNGRFRRWDEKHLSSGAQRVVVSTIVDNPDRTVVFGVNQNSIKDDDRIISNASCTSNAVIPIIFVLQKLCKITEGNVTSIHAFTNGQNIVDGCHEDLRRARSVFNSIIPSNTNASTAIEKLFPSLKERINCTAVRVPVSNVSAIDCNFILERNVSNEELHEFFDFWSRSNLKGILSTSDDPRVSVDFNSDLSSCVIDKTLTYVVNKRLCRIFAWYNNELAYAQRLFDLIEFLSRNGGKS